LHCALSATTGQVSKASTLGGRHAQRASPHTVARGPHRKGGFHRLIPGLGSLSLGIGIGSASQAVNAGRPGKRTAISRGTPHTYSVAMGAPTLARELYPMSAENLKPDSNLKLSQVSKALTRGGRHAPRAFPLPAVRGSRRKGGFHRLILGLGQRGPDREACSDQPRDSPHLLGGDGSPNVGPRAVPKNAESQSQSAYQIHHAQESA